MGVFNKTIIPLALVGFKTIILYDYDDLKLIMPYALRWIYFISYPTQARGVIVK